MNTPRATHWAESIGFVIAFFLVIALVIDAAYNFGYGHGAASVVCPKPIPKLSYDMPRKQLLRRIRYEQSKGGVK
jgi:hypothetical protein